MTTTFPRPVPVFGQGDSAYPGEVEALRSELAITRHHLLHALEGRHLPGTPAPSGDAAGHSGADASEYHLLFSVQGPGGKPLSYYTMSEARPWWKVALRHPLKIERWIILRRVQRRRRRFEGR